MAGTPPYATPFTLISGRRGSRQLAVVQELVDFDGAAVVGVERFHERLGRREGDTPTWSPRTRPKGVGPKCGLPNSQANGLVG